MIKQARPDTGDKVADALKNSWVYHLPRWAWPYAQLARWERPIGWQLLMWPCWWSSALAFQVATANQWSVGQVAWQLFAFHLMLYLVGAVMMRGAGCTYNDLVDQDIDDKVARTRSRPLPSGRVRRRSALAFLVVQALVGLAVLLALSLTHQFTFWLGVASLATIAIYPFMKRVTWWPQLFLGLAFSWGALMGWAAVFGELAAPALLLYAGCIFWVIGYDTIYAHQDIEDDALVGVKSTARLFADNTAPALSVLYGVAVLLWGIGLYSAGAGMLSWLGLVVVAIHLVRQIRSLRIDDPDHCLAQFKSNSVLGLIFFAFLAADFIRVLNA